MDDQFLPWWSILLLGMWAVAVTLWVHPKVNQELRLWAGLASLVYMVLIFIALTASPRPAAEQSANSFNMGPVGILTSGLCAISLTACLWSLSPISTWCRQVCYAVFTLANAGICLLYRQPELSVALFVAAGLTVRPLLRTYLSTKAIVSARARFAQFIQFSDRPTGDFPEFWRIGVLTSLFAVTVLGTITYSTCVENVRPASETQSTLLPTTALMTRILGQTASQPESSNLVDAALSTRADLVVLMAIILFLKLGMSMSDHGTSAPSPLTAPMTESPREETL